MPRLKSAERLRGFNEIPGCEYVVFVIDHPFDLRLGVNSVEMERATRAPKDRQYRPSSLARVLR